MPKITLVLECEEETASEYLIKLLEKAKDLIGNPDYMICLDSGLVDYKNIWITSSLRGYCEFNIKVEAAEMEYHSGECGGIVPDTFRILRTLLDRLDDSQTGICKVF